MPCDQGVRWVGKGCDKGACWGGGSKMCCEEGGMPCDQGVRWVVSKDCCHLGVG